VLTHRAVHMLFATFLVCTINEALFALYPLFAFTPRESGGLGLDEAQIGIHMSIRAVTQILALIPMPHLHRRLGTKRLYQLASISWPITVLGFPVVSRLAGAYGEPDAPQVLVAVLALFIVWMFTVWTWPCLMILVNEAAPSPEALGRLNGASSPV